LKKLWLYDLNLGAMEKLTTESNSSTPVWTPDGERLIYNSARRGNFDILSKPVGAFGSEEVILEDDGDQAPAALSPDGKWLAVELWLAEMGKDLALLELGAGSGLTTVVTSPFLDEHPSFSRDSAWLAYSSNVSGRWEVYAQPVRGDGVAVKISADGGDFSVWSPTRDELYYQRESTIMAVSYEVAGGALRPGVPRPLAQMPDNSALSDIAPDGERFLILTPTGEDPPSTELHVTLNWFEELKRLVPTDN
jgi:dipeptidyl aminopeptidase/acylaminoacyl peptidase